MKYIEKYYQKFFDENDREKYKFFKKERVIALKNDPGPWHGPNTCSYNESKKTNPDLYKWYNKKHETNRKIAEVNDAITDIEDSVIEKMETIICKAGNAITLRNPVSRSDSSFTYIILEKHNRDNYLVYEMNNLKDTRILHWKRIVKLYKLKEYSEG